MKANYEAYEAVRSQVTELRTERSEAWAGATKSASGFIISSKLSNLAPINPADQLRLATDDMASKLAAFNAAPTPGGLSDLELASRSVIEAAVRVHTRPSPAYGAIFNAVMSMRETARETARRKII